MQKQCRSVVDKSSSSVLAVTCRINRQDPVPFALGTNRSDADMLHAGMPDGRHAEVMQYNAVA